MTAEAQALVDELAAEQAVDARRVQVQSKFLTSLNAPLKDQEDGLQRITLLAAEPQSEIERLMIENGDGALRFVA